ncbi:MAG TPA: VWA-like domain-containing protein [Candidatus Ozemobacteraceae bacterium]|nr:VWA-like domain-containing protein [Candidatus Ozemobacteraceae bacterium]
MNHIKEEQRDILAATELRRLAGVRLRMLDKQPFWGHLLMNLQFRSTFELPAPAATDCLRVIWFNPQFTAQLSFAQLGFLLAHEVGHIALLTQHRQNGRDSVVWNHATDYAINRLVASTPDEPDVKRPLYEVPVFRRENGELMNLLLNPDFDDLPAEAIYQRLLLETPTRNVVIRLRLPGSHAGRQNDDQPQEQTPGNLDDGDLVIDGIVDHGGGLDVHLPDWVTQRDLDEWQRMIREALGHWNRSGRRGTVPSDRLRQLANGGKLAARDWRALLRQHVERSLEQRDEYSRARPHRRYLLQDLIVPSVEGETVAELVIALDTSGSMNDQLLSSCLQAVSQLSRVADQCLLLTADARVHDVIRTADIEAFVNKRNVTGGGGTDHRPVFTWLAERQIVPALFIGITDLQSAFPKTKPEFPVLWLTPKWHWRAPWGTVIEVDL